MNTDDKQWPMLDRAIVVFDNLLRMLTHDYPQTDRPNPTRGLGDELLDSEKSHAAGLMRVNHAGEVCAQALYQGHAWVARQPATKAHFLKAASEENDHLAWCYQRLKELNSRPSYLDPFWYIGSFTIGVSVGLLGDRWGLGFVKETERQVAVHLDKHLQILPKNDIKSRAIITQMKIDEMEHEKEAIEKGAMLFPSWLQTLMRYTAKVMTKTAYYV